MKLPTWTECESKCDEETANPIEYFIYRHEEGYVSDEWRYDLRKALEFVAEHPEAICKQ